MFNAGRARTGQKHKPIVMFANGDVITADDIPNSATNPFPLRVMLGEYGEKDLRGATFQNIFFDPTSVVGLRDRPLSGARFINCSGLRLQNVYLDGADLIDCSISSISRTDMRAARIESSSIDSLYAVNLSHATLRDVFTDGAAAQDVPEGVTAGRWGAVDLSDTMIDGLRLNHAAVTNCELTNAVIKNSHLTDTRFTFTPPSTPSNPEPQHQHQWENTRWSNVRLHHVEFRDAQFISNDFRTVNLAAADIDTARFDYSTFDVDVDLSTDRALNVVLAAPGVHLRADPHGPAPADPAAHMTVTIDEAGRSPNDPPAIEFEVPGADLEHALAAAHRRLGTDVHTEITSRDRDGLDADVKDRDGQLIGTVAIAHDTPPTTFPSNSHGLARGHEAIARSFPSRAATGRTGSAPSPRPASSTAAARGPMATATASHFER